MSRVLLIYPFFRDFPDRSVFRFPPLGVGYVAAALREAGHEVRLLDCTFRKRSAALREALEAKAEVVGIYCMVSMTQDCFRLARRLRHRSRLLVAGGPLPTCDPAPFLEHFDVVVRGEGEQTMKELLQALEEGSDLASVPGIAFRKAGAGAMTFTPQRTFREDLDRMAFPARDLLPNERYIRQGKSRQGYSITTVLSSRGCPYRCEFCSNVIFGSSYRERSAENVVDEIETALGLGYDRISFADDVFTMRPARVREVCEEIRRRGLKFRWECLGRVDSLDEPTARQMKRAGCSRVFFGIESGNDRILRLMNKGITTGQAASAVEAARRAGLEVGAFFILGYPGETDRTVLETLRFATALPLDYLGLTMPYPLPGTALLERVRSVREWRPADSLLANHVLTFDADFSEAKLWFAILKGRTQFLIRRCLGPPGRPLLKLFETATDALFRLLR